LRLDLDKGPLCECQRCDARGKETGVEVRLPMDAWLIAGGGVSEEDGRIAVAPGHEDRFRIEGREIVYHDGWVAVG